VEVLSAKLPEGRKLVAPRELARTLASLPPEAWPYGKVAAVQEIGIRDDKAKNRLREVKRAAEELLKRLDIEAEWWPSS
jgi:hypothetical protein